MKVVDKVRGWLVSMRCSVPPLDYAVCMHQLQLYGYDDRHQERGAVNTMSASVPDLGLLVSAEVRLRETSGPVHSQWHLDKLEIVHKLSGKRTIFPCQAWISKTAEGETGTILLPSIIDNVYIDYQVRASFGTDV